MSVRVVEPRVHGDGFLIAEKRVQFTVIAERTGIRTSCGGRGYKRRDAVIREEVIRGEKRVYEERSGYKRREETIKEERL